MGTLLLITEEIRYVAWFCKGIVDANGNFLDVRIGWAGSTDDSHIWQNSQIGKQVFDGRFGDLQGVVPEGIIAPGLWQMLVMD